MKEQWKDIENYPNYQVSNLGNIRNRLTGKFKKPSMSKDGYLVVHLWKKDKMKTFKIHRLVATTFIPNSENKRTVNHINGCKTDNYVSNLEWNTDSENVKHAFQTGLNFHSDKSGNLKQKVRCIETGQVFESQLSASEYFGCNHGSIQQSIHKGYRVLKKYHFELV